MARTRCRQQGWLFWVISGVVGLMLSLSTVARAETDISVTQANQTVHRIKLIETMYQDYQRMLLGHDPFDVASWGRLNLSRSRAELLLMQVAPVLGGCDCRIEYEPQVVYTPHARSLAKVREATEVTHAIAVFSGDERYQQSGFLLSEPVLDIGDFFVGFYTTVNRQDILSLRDPAKLKSLRYVVVESWLVDVETLRQAGLSPVYADTWSSAIQMLATQRADVILQPFTQADDFLLLDTSTGFALKPIEGIKLPFPQARQYVVSSRHAEGESFLAALNEGIGQLKDLGAIRRLMVSAGVINPNTQRLQALDWVD